MARRARAEKLPFQEVQRARIVLYAANGMPDTEIAVRLDTTARIVGKWRRRFFYDRLEGLKDKPLRGPWAMIVSVALWEVGWKR